MGIDWRKNRRSGRAKRVSDAEWSGGQNVYRPRPKKRLEIPDLPKHAPEEETDAPKIPQGPAAENAENGGGTPSADAGARRSAQKRSAAKTNIFGRSKWHRRERKNVITGLKIGDTDENISESPKDEAVPPATASDAAAQEEKPPRRDASSAPEEARPPETPRRRRRSQAPEAPEKEKLGIKLARAVIAIIILGTAGGVYFLWSEYNASEMLPTMVMPQYYLYEEEKEVRALLVWQERLLKSDVSGSLQLSGGGQVTAVAAGDIVATVLSRGKNFTVKAPVRGYFVPALDGAEGKWLYGPLWAGSGVLPEAPTPEWIDDLSTLGGERIVGKLIDLPQKVKAIFYIDLTDTLMKALDKGTIGIKRAPHSPKWPSKVRVSMKYDDAKAKVVIDMPYFPMDMVPYRETSFLVCAEEIPGLAVPETAVVIRSGAYGVFELVGDRLTFKKVTGKPIAGSRFFISSGLSPGNPVIMDATNAKEKRVRLW